jgi:hypothetical protein
MGAAIAAAAVFVWLGMVVAISFIEAPLKFRAPGVTLPIGLGIGRLVFRALNTVEAALAVVIVIALSVSPAPVPVAAAVVAVGALVLQLAAVRPRLTRRTDAVLAGSDTPRSDAHHVYIGLEAIKVIALIVAGIALLSR